MVCAFGLLPVVGGQTPPAPVTDQAAASQSTTAYEPLPEGAKVKKLEFESTRPKIKLLYAKD